MDSLCVSGYQHYFTALQAKLEFFYHLGITILELCDLKLSPHEIAANEMDATGIGGID